MRHRMTATAALVTVTAAVIAGCSGATETASTVTVTASTPTGAASPPTGAASALTVTASTPTGTTPAAGTAPAGGAPGAGPASTTPGGSAPGAGEGRPVTAGSGKCLDPSSAAVTTALAGLGKYRGRVPYRAYRSSPEAVGSCPELLWVLAGLEGATGSSPDQVLLFDASGYLGTTTARPSAFTTIAGHTADSVSVTYSWLTGDEPNCCPQGGPVTVKFTLRGGKVTPDRPIPAEALVG